MSCISAACTGHQQFDPQQSPSAVQVNCDGSEVSGGTLADQITITFGTGKITGDCYHDQICIGNACTMGDLIVSTDESELFGAFGFDGVLGLARTGMAQGDSFAMMERFKSHKSLNQ